MAIFHISSIKPSQAEGEVKEVYDQLKKEMGNVVEPVSMHAIIPDLLKSNWCILREALVVNDMVNRKYKEAIASAISSLNDCPYCVDAHTIMLIGLNDKQTAKAIDQQNLSLVKDAKTKALLEWAYNTKFFHSESIVNPPFSREEAPEIIGTAVQFHYLNRMVTIFLGETILPFNINFLKGLLKKVAALMFSKALKSEKKGNNALEFIDLGDKGDPYFWSKENLRIEKAFSSFYTIVEDLATNFIPPSIKIFLENEIKDWEGSEYLKADEMEEKVSGFNDFDKKLASILYLVAFAPYRINEKLILEVKKSYSLSDEQLLAMFSWTAYMTATKIGEKIGVSFK